MSTTSDYRPVCMPMQAAVDRGSAAVAMTRFLAPKLVSYRYEYYNDSIKFGHQYVVSKYKAFLLLSLIMIDGAGGRAGLDDSVCSPSVRKPSLAPFCCVMHADAGFPWLVCPSEMCGGRRPCLGGAGDPPRQNPTAAHVARRLPLVPRVGPTICRRRRTYHRCRRRSRPRRLVY